MMIVVDMSQPWNILESLERWAEVLSKHISGLKVPDKEMKEMRERSKWGGEGRGEGEMDGREGWKRGR